ncbi:hypothetical protein SLOPH_1011 [Spraguea lophii 42_110]|uniref:Uncharacterized protein n=1 Tax=Spraguea lophii (strain 42_110) TaxID=1358809 RepID=S7W7H9_SPRLO|nr:hypothetical protein SLOPH_1011 [Spraguea lophii 42_110]
MWNSIKILHHGKKCFGKIEIMYKDIGVDDLISKNTIRSEKINIEIYRYENTILENDIFTMIDLYSYTKDNIVIFSKEKLPIISEEYISKEQYIKYLKPYLKKFILTKMNVPDNKMITKTNFMEDCMKLNHLDCVTKLVTKTDKFLYAITYLKKNKTYTIDILNMLLEDLPYKSEDFQLKTFFEIKNMLIFSDLILTIKLLNIKTYQKKILMYFHLAHEFIHRYKKKLAVNYFKHLQEYISNQPFDKLNQYIEYNLNNLIEEKNWKEKILKENKQYIFYQKEGEIKINKFWIEPVPNILKKINTLKQNEYIPIKNISFYPTQKIYKIRNQLFNYIPESLNNHKHTYTDTITMNISIQTLEHCKSCKNGCNKNTNINSEIEILQIITDKEKINIFKKIRNSTTINLSCKSNIIIKSITYLYNHKIYKFDIKPIEFIKIECLSFLKFNKDSFKIITGLKKAKVYGKKCMIERIHKNQYKITEIEERAEIHVQVNEEYYQKYIL